MVIGHRSSRIVAAPSIHVVEKVAMFTPDRGAQRSLDLAMVELALSEHVVVIRLCSSPGAVENLRIARPFPRLYRVPASM